MAVRDGPRSLTFEELDVQAGSLAGHLLERLGEHGGAPERVVPLLVGRDLASVVAIHAAVRAGVAFAPLEADLSPAEIASRWHRLGGSPVAVVSRPEVPPPSGIPATLLHVEGSRAPATWWGVAPDRSQIPVGGDHNRMLEPPHVADLRGHVAEVLHEMGPGPEQ